ncbi:hypothetical protein vseg_012504 [Gypsophila vaccaria]
MTYLSDNHENNGHNVTTNNNNNFQKWLGFCVPSDMNMEGKTCSNSPSSSNNIDLHIQHYENQQHRFHGAAACYDNNGSNNNSNGGGPGRFLSTPLSVMPLMSDGSLCILEALTSSQQTHVSAVPKLENFFGSGQERETMGLSLDSSYYHQTPNQQLESYLSAISSQGFSEDGLFKNWIDSSDNMTNTSNNVNGGSSPVSCGELQYLSLSMSPGSQSSCVTGGQSNRNNGSESALVNATESGKKRDIAKVGVKQTVHRKSIDTFGQRTSQFRGVTKHRWTGRYEAHLWDNSCKKEGQTRKGRQGGYDMEEKAATAYDLAALKYWGLQTHTNFPLENYKDETEQMKSMTRQEYVAHLRRKSSGFSRGASIYRGVTRHHQHGRWQARIGRVAGNKDLYLGTFSTQEEAAEAYDVAAIKFRGLNAVTNFDISRYHVEKIMSSNSLLASEQAKRDTLEPIKPTFEGPTAQIIPCQNPQAPYLPSPNSLNHDDYANQSFSLALRDIVGHEADGDSVKLGSAQLSNGSSLVTSLHSSREGSPREESLLLSHYGSKFVGPASVVSPWIAATQSAAISVANHPVFAAWGNA